MFLKNIKIFKIAFVFIIFFAYFFTYPVFAGEPLSLVSSKVDSAPKLDGDGSDPQWKTAKEMQPKRTTSAPVSLGEGLQVV